MYVVLDLFIEKFFLHFFVVCKSGLQKKKKKFRVGCITDTYLHSITYIRYNLILIK